MSFQAMAKAVAIKTESATDKLVLLMIANYADENNQAFPSYKRLASDCCMTDRAVKAVIGRLKKQGFLSWVKRQNYQGGLTSNLYTLHLDCSETPMNTDSENNAPPPHDKKGGSDLNSLGVVKQIHQGSEPDSQEPISKPINGTKTTTTTEKDEKISLAEFVDLVSNKMKTSPVDGWFIEMKSSEIWERYDIPSPSMAMGIIWNDWQSIQ